MLEESFVITTAHNISGVLSFILTDKDFEHFFRTKDGKHFKILIQKLVSKEEQHVGKIIIINNEGKVTFDSDTFFTGKNYIVLKDTYPNYYDKIKKFLKKPEASGFFYAKSQNSSNEKDLKFFASKYLQKSSLTLFYFINVPLQIVSQIHDDITTLAFTRNS